MTQLVQYNNTIITSNTIIQQQLKDIEHMNQQKKIEQQMRTIEYIRGRYKQRTGEDIVMPKTWQQYLDVDEDDTPCQPLPIPHLNELQQQLTFQLAIDQLSLPTRLSYNKLPLTSFTPSNKFHMIEHIHLCNFKDKGFSKNLFRQFLSRIVEMRCLKMVALKSNGIGEECAQQIQTLVNIKRITRVDLSRNQMGKNCLQIISKNFNHLQWIDLSRNAFIFQKAGLQALLNALRVNGRIYHIQLDLQDSKLLQTLTSYLKIKPQIHSFGPVDSKITVESMDHICHVLQTKQSKKDTNRLINLNFQFCYLERKEFDMLLKALSANNTLIKLSLASNNIGEPSAILLCQVLSSHLSLIDVNLSSNLLEDQFAVNLAKCLAKNQLMQTIDISRNNIGGQGGSALLGCLSQTNDTVQSFGAFQTNSRMGSELIQKIKKALRINRVSKQIRSSLLKSSQELSPLQITNRQTQAFLQSQYKQYELAQPINITNPLRDDPFKINIWQFK